MKGETSLNTENGIHSSFSSDSDEPCWHSPDCESPYDNDDRRSLSRASSHESIELSVTCGNSFMSSYSIEIDLESGLHECKLGWQEKDDEKVCRICHLGLQSAAEESGVAIQIGCSCKDDLANAHKQCAETWFKIKGNKSCEICGSIALNVVGPGDSEVVEQCPETSAAAALASITAAPPNDGRRSFLQGHRFLNFLLACMIFSFVVSWLFHFNVPG